MNRVELDPWLAKAAQDRVHLAAMVDLVVEEIRQRGGTIRGTIDVIIATWCLENGAALLHDDRDFDVLERHLNLSVWRVSRALPFSVR